MRNRNLQIASVRPLVRYVDKDQAVLDTHIMTAPVIPDGEHLAAPTVDVLLEITGSDGFYDESQSRLELTNGAGDIRFDVICPQRWWPAGMGEQHLYELAVSLMMNDFLIDQKRFTLGFTSVRAESRTGSGNGNGNGRDNDTVLLVNGEICEIQSVVVVDQVNEKQLLPATGDSLMLVRDHYGPDVLYQAADRAGILMVQCIPIHPDGTPEVDVESQIDRLASHPSLAGWYVGHLGGISDYLAGRLRKLDPTHAVFRDFDIAPAA